MEQKASVGYAIDGGVVSDDVSSSTQVMHPGAQVHLRHKAERNGTDHTHESGVKPRLGGAKFPPGGLFRGKDDQEQQ